MSHLEEQLQRRAQSYLFSEPSEILPVVSGWRDYTPNIAGTAHKRFSVLTPLPRHEVDAIEAAL